MDRKELSERIARLQEVAGFIKELPSEIRNDAFDLLKDYVTGVQDHPANKDGGREAVEDIASDGTGLFGRFDHDKPSDNVRLIAAYFLQEYGSEPFSAEDVKTTATDTGITIPERVDMTIISAQENGKNLFARAGRGKFKPTVHGETFLKETYQVRKGKGKREADRE